MRQDIERENLGREPRNRFKLASLLGLAPCFLLGTTSQGFAGDGDLPELAKPNEMPVIVSTPAGAGQSPTKPTNPQSDRAVLALPGITTPAAPKPSTASPTLRSTPADSPVAGGLKLDAPVEMNGSPSTLTPLPRVSPSPMPGRSPRPLTLDSNTDEPVPIDGPAVRSYPEAKRPSTAPRVAPQPATQPQKRGRLFGLFPGPAPAPVPASNSANHTGSSLSARTAVPGRSVAESPAVDVSSESALKRRIEKQAREVVGDRARSIEVRVVGKVAVVQARGVKLFQKRNVRKSLEGIPSLSGLRSSIEVLD